MDKNVCPLCGGDKAAAHILCIDCFNILWKDRAWKFDDLRIFLSKETARADAAEKELENALSAVMDAVERSRPRIKARRNPDTEALKNENERLRMMLRDKEAELEQYKSFNTFKPDYELFYRETKR